MVVKSHPSIERARKVAFFMDSAFTIPVIRKKIGWDPIIGLLPIGGDVLGMIISSYLIWVAYELGLPRHVMLRMTFNIILDWGLGAIPLLGDWVDMAWKANQANLRILETAYAKYGSPIDNANNPKAATVNVLAEPI